MSGGLLTTCIKTSQCWIKMLVEGVMLMGCNKERKNFTTVNGGTSLFTSVPCVLMLLLSSVVISFFSTHIVLCVPNATAACTLMRRTLPRHNLPHAEQDKTNVNKQRGFIWWSHSLLIGLSVQQGSKESKIWWENQPDNPRLFPQLVRQD